MARGAGRPEQRGRGSWLMDVPIAWRRESVTADNVRSVSDGP